MWISNIRKRSSKRTILAGRARAPDRAPRQPTGPIALAALATCLGACQGSDPGELQAAADPLVVTAAARGEHARRCDWEQWGQGPEHEGAACEEVDQLHRISAHLTFDPFVDQELADAAIQHGDTALFIHYQTPLLVDDDVYMEFKAGTYTSCASVPKGAPCGRDAWNSQVWTERAFHGANAHLVTSWTFASDWKPEPGQFASWEPVFHAIVVGRFVYVPGASGSLHKLDRHTGRELATIRLPGVGDDPNTFVAGGIVADLHGNLLHDVGSAQPHPRSLLFTVTVKSIPGASHAHTDPHPGLMTPLRRAAKPGLGARRRWPCGPSTSVQTCAASCA